MLLDALPCGAYCPKKYSAQVYFVVDYFIAIWNKGTSKKETDMNKPIHITADKRESIKTALKAVNGRADTFTVTSYFDVSGIADRAEKALDALPKANRVGARCSYIPEGPTARAYKYAAKSTRIEIERKRGGWFLAAVESDEVYPKSGEKFQMHVTREQRDEIARRAIDNFHLIKGAE
jgi:hypothetical protein